MATFSKQSLLCPNCRRLVSRDEPICPYCGLSRPGSRLKKSLHPRLIADGDLVIKTIIGVNIAVFVLSLVMSRRHGGGGGPFSFLSPSDRSLLLLGATGAIPIDRFHRWWSLLAANYLHANLIHILFNMLAFRQLGPLVAREYGAARLIIIYTLTGVAGFGVSYLAGVAFTIGASAAVCGLIGAALYFGKSRGGVYGQTVYSQLGGWAVTIFIFGFLVPGINNWGHGGGLVAGVALGYLLGYTERGPESTGHRLLAAGCVAATGLVLAWAVLTSAYYTLGVHIP